MSTPIYTTNHRRNLILYWRQYFPNWTIPKGYHVHHIKPKCTFEDRNNPAIHHPKNLIALHPDDHASIHKCRGDKIVHGFITSSKGKKQTLETKNKISNKLKNKPKPPCSDAHRQAISDGRKGQRWSNEAKKDFSIKRKELNKLRGAVKWFNNGLKRTLCVPGFEPDGYILGYTLCPQSKRR